ncbi:hypothetical protein KsCSTR_43100 [Candidatus Kuenenia stuttgartiensis]|uniref:Uncharacterized protein n=1 Tax=Kuenenia stuttgartiensis TaxID=174633 RepID=A0A6G7GWP8_KUEST|nr:hypothetical protein KsCSTR_43100 [Candidatus Kuenenia stuttgartiensis]
MVKSEMLNTKQTLMTKHKIQNKSQNTQQYEARNTKDALV